MFLPALFSALMPVLFLDGLFPDMVLVLKVFTLMAIISYITNHLGKGPIAILLIAVFSWFIIFDYFAFFGGIYILYMLLVFGLTGVIIDIFFITPQGGHGAQAPGMGETGEPISSGQEFVEKRTMHPRGHR
jgi:hypothetical protein